MSDFHDQDDDPRPRQPRQPRARGGGATYAGRGSVGPSQGASERPSDGPSERGPQRPSQGASVPSERGPQRPSQGASVPSERRPQRPSNRSSERPYNLYRSTPRSLGARLRGETDAELAARADELSRRQPPRPPRGSESSVGRGGRSGGPGGPPPRRGWRRIPGFGPSLRPLWHPLRLLKYVVLFCIFWVALSVVLFFVSASGGNLPGGSATANALSSGGPMLLSPNNILVVGLDTRPTSGYSSHEGGLSAADHNELSSRTDTLMIWHVGGGVSRKLSIPRDTLITLPAACGGYKAKINAAWSCGGPKATIQAVESLTGLKINHMIVVDLGNFVKFIDDIGGVTVNTPRICSNISGGAKNGGYTLMLRPGSHHLTGIQAVTLARTRDNSCNLAYTDINREKMQQGIMNGIKNQLFSAHAFMHLPWASWDAPKAVQTDMGPVTLLQLFAAAEIGGSSPARTLQETSGYYNGQDVLNYSQSDVRRKVNQLLNG